MTDDTSTEKRCKKCGEIKPVEAFSKDRKAKDGRQSACKACNQHYYLTNITMIRERQAAYYSANAEKIRESTHAWAKDNPQKVIETHQAYAKAHRQQIRKRTLAWRTANYEILLEKRRARRAADPDKHRAHNAARRARKNANGGEGFSRAELSTMRQAQNGFCAYCGFPWVAPLQIDHVIPLLQGGPHEAANIILACPDCNSEKSGRTPEQWTNRWYQRIEKSDKN
jgi:hypothetical protein